VMITTNLKCAAAHFRFSADRTFMRTPVAESPTTSLCSSFRSPHNVARCQRSDQFVGRTKST
jgi:hypothetical protein